MKRWKRASAAPSTPPPPLIGVQSAETTVSAFLADLAVLRGVPLSYLVPYAEMLPPESLLFFFVDPNWMQALFQGALSLGAQGVVPPPAVVGQPVLDDQPAPATFGFLLNSVLVRAYPTMVVRAVATDGSTPAPLRLENVTPDLLIAVYDRPLTSITLTQPHEGFELGFELDEYENGLPVFQQQLRQFASDPIGAAAGVSASILLKPCATAQFQSVDLQGTLVQFNAKITDNPLIFVGQSLLDAGSFPIELVQQASAVQFNVVAPSLA